ncbi:hypothetical protein [Legionella sp.]|uniref:hypothetical protein n=1 Tax=Legionella sp. TaxID=459 RepID=UPI003C9E347E
MKNVLTIVLSLCLIHSSLSIAGGMERVDTNWIRNGFYVASEIGVAGLVDKESHSSFPETHQLGALGIIGGGYAGYEYGFKQYGLALEFFADATGLNAAITHEPYTYHHHQSYDLGVRVLPQYIFTPNTSGHIVLGYTNGKFNIFDNGVYGYINTGYNKSGFQTGLGFTNRLQNNVLFRLDAIYDMYASQSSRGLGLTSGTIQLYKNTFSTLTGKLSLIYKFS